MMTETNVRSWRWAFAWAAVWVVAATVVTFTYTFEWLGRPLPHAIWAVLGFMIFAGNLTLPITSGLVHRSWRMGIIAVVVLGLAILAVVFLVGLILFAGAAGGLH